VNQPIPEPPASRRARDRRRRWAEIATIVTVPLAAVALVVGVLQWRAEVSGGQDRDAGDRVASTGTGAVGPDSGAATPASGGGQPAAARPVAALQVRAGGANIEVAGDGRTLVMPCGSNNSDDAYREVEYWLRGAYRGFAAQFEVTEVDAPEVRTQLEVFTDSVRSGNVVLAGKQGRRVTATIAGGQVLKLRLTCESSDTVVAILDAAVTP